MSYRRVLTPLIVGALSLVAAVAGGAVAPPATAAPTVPPPAAQPLALQDDAARCSGPRTAFELLGQQRCTHGPDRLPAGVDLQRDGLTEAATASVSLASTTSVPCYGDGTSGKRVQAIYAHAADVPSRYLEAMPQIRTWAAGVDDIFRDSAAETGGVRHVRWVTNAACELDVLDIEMPAVGDDSYIDTLQALQSYGHLRTDRKYLVWVDAAMFCGIGDFADDDAASSRNANNGGPSYSRIDRGCWGLANAVEAHELMHNLGGVQFSVPNSSGGGHCLDESDRMCYRDSVNVATSQVCDIAHERLFDCNHDDYYSTAPPFGSYLSKSWNAANSAYLVSTEPGVTTKPVRGGGKR